MTDQEQARENAARELARRLEHVTSLADPLAFARDYWADATAHGWRYIPTTLDIRDQIGRADPPNEEFRRAKEALTRKDRP